MAQAGRRALIDTSVLIAHFRGRLFLHSLARSYDDLYVSAITLYELEYGASRAGRASDFARFELDFHPTVLAVGRAEAGLAAHLNGALARSNQHIGPRDALIAGTALRHNLELLTLNTAEFSRVPGLKLGPLP